MEKWRTQGDPVARTAIDEIEGDAPVVTAWDLENAATRAHGDLPKRDAVELAEANGCRVAYDRTLPPGVEGLLLSNGTILVRLVRDRRRLQLAVLHELAHWLLRKVAHSHGDVWCLTLALAVPMGEIRALKRAGQLSLAELHWRIAVADWALEARLHMPTVERAA